MAKRDENGIGTRERRLMESESRWLQKALFALSKARDDREKLASRLAEDVDSIGVEIKGKSLDLVTVRSAMKNAVDQRVEELRESIMQQRAALR